MPTYFAIVAATVLGAISEEGGQLPWDIRQDLEHFRKATFGKICVCGANTYESLGARPLAGRRFAVLTSRKYPELEGVEFFSSVEELLEAYKDLDEEIAVIGGGQVYESMLQYCDVVQLTTVYFLDFEPEAWFPLREMLTEFTVVDQSMKKQEGPYEFKYSTWVRNSKLND